MRKLIVLILVCSFSQAFAQLAPNKFLVRFTDKKYSPYELTKPEEFLTQRAIDRRLKFGIDIDSTDLPIDPVYIQGVATTGAKLIIQVKWINALIVETESSSVIDAIDNLSYVLDIDTVNKRSSQFKSIDKFALEQRSSRLKSSVDNDIYGNAFNQIDMINGIPLHEAGFKGSGIVIGVLDAGFVNTNVRTIFNALWDNNQILGSRNFVNPSEDVFRYNTHGTGVLSIMGGQLPGLYLGSAPEAGYWLLLTEETGSEFLIEEYNWIAGAAFADSVGVDIINSSLGYTEFDNSIYDHAYSDLDGNTTEVTNAADLAAAKG
ncbi:MAG: serine protease, partial [Bacteroidales bacterium]|nr:serine protease [Bacteroidales bacterium]